MDNEIKAWLYDILNAIMEIDSFFIDIPKEFSTYKDDLRTRRAIERNIEIIWGNSYQPYPNTTIRSKRFIR